MPETPAIRYFTTMRDHHQPLLKKLLKKLVRKEQQPTTQWKTITAYGGQQSWT